MQELLLKAQTEVLIRSGLIEPPYGIIYDIFFANKYTGWACGNYSDDSYLAKTTTGGNNSVVIEGSPI